MNLKAYLIQAAAGAALLAAGSTIVSNKVDLAAQNIRIERLETLDTNVDGLRQDLSRVDRHLSAVEGKLQQQDIDHGR